MTVLPNGKHEQNQRVVVCLLRREDKTIITSSSLKYQINREREKQRKTGTAQK